MSEQLRRVGRRSFLRKAAVGAGVAAATAVSTGAAAEPSRQMVTPEEWDMEVDVVVAGAGHGGLCAAVAAAEEGADVLLLEISSKTGGGSAWSGGYIHAMGLQDWEEYNAHTEGLHDPVLGRPYIETFRNEFIPWLEEIGAYFEGPGAGIAFSADYSMGHGEPGYLRHRLYFDSLEEALARFGGTLMTRMRAVKLFADEEGNVVGLRAVNVETGEVLNIGAKAVILATGNFMANKEMLNRYVGPFAHRAKLMGVPYSTGEGIMMAQEVGAILSGNMSTWSGTLVALTPGDPLCANAEEYERVLQETPPEELGGPLSAGRVSPPGWLPLDAGFFSGQVRGLLVNKEGKRFIDESSPLEGKYVRLQQAVLNQTEGMAYQIGDQAIFDAAMGSAAAIEAIEAEGGTVIVADTLEELADQLAERGVRRGAFLRTIEEYNQAIADETTMDLDVPRAAGLFPIENPPFYAIAVTAQIYMTFGGIAINEKCQALDRQKGPIPGLYAVPPAGGGVFDVIYGGGIGIAGTFGYLAGKAATEVDEE
ncbi:MAG: FAD-binding protein [Anaerolineae bacterium]|nr:FAD-binding protein [Anaerolineae bacterium]